MKQRAPFWIGASLLLASAGWAQLDLGGMYTQTVKTGQPWAAIDTKVNSLAMNIQINRGVVTTVATVEYTPGNGQVSEYVCTPVKCDWTSSTCLPQTCEYRPIKDLPLDSLETTAGFSQADNTVITDMYLWVGDVKVKAALQDRALASAQYEDIVKRRRDPALIETWGNGYYNLRIFPNESGKSRKIEIEFVQGMETEGDAFKTILPVIHRLAKIATAGAVDYTKLPNRTIGAVSLMAVALDGKSYSLKWEGLGSGVVSSNPLRLAAAGVQELKAGELSTAASSCSGCLTPWISERSSVSYFGVKTILDSKKLKFEAQPAERNFLLDVDAKDTLVAARARKVTLLSLKAYGAAPYSANVGLADGKGGIAFVFPKAVTMDAENLRKAYEAIKAWKPNADADARATLRGYARTRGTGSAPSVAFLVNNDTTPYFRWPMVTNPDPRTGTQAQYEAWEKEQALKDDEVTTALQNAKGVLFGFWNDYRLNRVANATGGFQIGTLNGYIYYPMMGGVVADVMIDKPVGPMDGIHLPPLFGPGRPDAYGIADLKVTASGLAVDRLVVLQVQRYWGYLYELPMLRAGGGVMVDALAKRSDFGGPGYGFLDSLTLRISGQYRGSGQVTLTVTGLWGGLRFTEELHADLPSTQAASATGASIWAYQQGEAWGRDMLKDDIQAIQQLGKDYHIVNRQMSLLALEPGMDLWTEMPGKEGGSGRGGNELVAGMPNSDSKLAPNGQNAGATLDNVSLEDILNGTVPVLEPLAGRTQGPGEISLRRSGGVIQLGWTLPGAEAGRAAIRILDLSGKSVAELVAARTATGFTAEWRNPGRNGAYFVIAQAGGRILVKKILVRP